MDAAAREVVGEPTDLVVHSDTKTTGKKAAYKLGITMTNKGGGRSESA